MPTSLKELYSAYTNYGTRIPTTELDGAKYVKVFKDAQLLGKGLTSTELDIIFSRVKVKGSRKIGYQEFHSSLQLVADKKSMDVSELEKILLASEGPQTHATKPDFVKFHDDKSMYTGVYAHGGPTTVDRTGELPDLLDRSAADVRGVRK